MPSKREMIEQLRMGKVSLPPLSFRVLQDEPKVGENLRFDALIEASWGGNVAKFVVECKPLSTPKAFRGGLSALKASSLPDGYGPLLFLPYLSEQQLQELEREKISGIDLCGNGVVIVLDGFNVFRSGGKNRFVSSAPIKNIYRKNSSMVGRTFLYQPDYKTVQDILEEVNRRNLLVKSWNKKPMSFSTVSKALKSLEDDLIIAREDIIRLLQPDKLLEKLSENYTPPKIKERIRLKISVEDGSIQDLLCKESQALGIPMAATGLSSVGLYAVMQRGDLLSIYCPRVDALLDRLPGRPDRFPNLELIETEDETVYFDCRPGDNFRWGSPVQVFLELMAGDKRDRESAEQVKSYIMNTFNAVRS